MRKVVFVVLVSCLLITLLFVGKENIPPVKASPGTVTIYGYCYYLDQYNTRHPIKYATVNLYDKTWYGLDRLLTDIYGNPCSTWTSAEGYYSFNPVENVDEFLGSGTLDVFIELLCDSGAVKVVPFLPINIWPYKGYSSVLWDVPDGTSAITWLCDDPDQKGCWGIYHSIIQAYQNTEEKVGYRIPKINVVWPWPWTHFADLWVLQYIGIESGYEWDPDAVCHEYGHWVMLCLYEGNVPLVDYGSDGVHYWDSRETTETAWVEGWANFYSCVIRDDRYFWSYDLESQLPPGDDVEGAIACILWDIYDSSNDGRDTLSLGFSPIWDVLKNYVLGGHHAFTIHEFWNGWLARGHNHAEQMWGIFYDHGLNKDNVVPNNPYSYTSNHVVRAWSSDNIIEVTWSGASDDLSGVYGYSRVWNTSPNTIPDTTVVQTGTFSISFPLSTGNSWYLHVRTMDNAGNWNPGAYHIGPFYVDTVAPSTPSPDDNVEDWSNDNTPTFTWSSSDSHSGVEGYYWKVDSGSETWTTSTSVTLPPQPDGVHTFYVKAEDNAGLLSDWGSHRFEINTTKDFLVVVDSADYEVTISSNSTITDFIFNHSGKQLSFNVTGPTGKAGYCNISIPEELLWGEFSVYKDGFLLEKDVDYTQTYDSTHYAFYITYIHSTHTIKIVGTEVIPEFPAAVIMPLFMFFVLIAIALAKKFDAK